MNSISLCPDTYIHIIVIPESGTENYYNTIEATPVRLLLLIGPKQLVQDFVLALKIDESSERILVRDLT